MMLRSRARSTRLRKERLTARRIVLLCAAAGGAAFLAVSAACGSSAAVAVGKPSPAKITVWLAGYGSGAKAGTPLRKWVDEQVTRFEKKFPGSSVDLVVQTSQTDQFLAVLRSAFAAHQVPDAMMLYSGGYTVDYGKSLLDLRKYITPPLYNQFVGWNLSCQDLSCGHGHAIYGVPNDTGGYALYYNKQLFAKAGIPAKQFTSWGQMLDAARQLKRAGIIPFAVGNRDGISSDIWVGDMIGSYIKSVNDLTGLRAGKLKWTDPRFVKPVEQFDSLFTAGLTNADARTIDLNAGNDYFSSGKAAMVAMYPISDFGKALGRKLGIMKIPPASNGPLSHAMNLITGQDWVIPADAKHADLGWEFIKTITDAQSQTAQLRLAGTPPANKRANTHAATDPALRQFIAYFHEPRTFPLVDTIVPGTVASAWYRELGAAFAGKQSAPAAMGAVEQLAETQGH